MRLTIRTPSRLHFSLIDMNGSLGRVNGSIGLAINYPNFIVKASPSSELKTLGGGVYLVKRAASIFYKQFELKMRATLEVKSTIPRHVGLGSATQTLLGVGTALSRIHGIKLSALELARIMGRGGTSGIGVAIHQSGGFVLDGGHNLKLKKEELFVPSSASTSPPPPTLIRYDFPKEWMFVIAIPKVQKGSHGMKEVNIFRERCPVPSEDVGSICRIILMKMLPSLVEKDIEGFGYGLNALQDLGFAKATQDLMHPTVNACLRFMRENGAHGSGQSSFGPTTYGLVDGESEAKKLSSKVEKFLEEKSIEGDVFYSDANNKGVEVKIDAES